MKQVFPLQRMRTRKESWRADHMLPSPSVPGSGERFDDAGVLLFHRVILEEVAVAG